MISIFKTIIFTVFLPLALFKDIFQSDRSIIRKIPYFILVALIFGTMWWSGYDSIKFLVTYNLYEAGITDKLTKVKTSGPSMMPTIPDGSEVTLNSPKKFGLSRGDIVSFKNIETGNLHYLKRIVGLPGEEVSIKNGFVAINDKILQEDYTLDNLPTFGNTFIVDCESYLVPKGHYVVLGDNRTVSWDSRAIGFVDGEDIDGVIKKNITEVFVSDIEQKQMLRANIDENLFRQKVNDVRRKNGSGKIIINTLLSEVARGRAAIIKNSFNDWKDRLPPLDKVLEEKQYSYNSVQEFITFGYLDEDSIIGQILESPSDKLAFLSSNYMEFGLGTVENENKECTFPIISVIISWPTTPTYSQEIISFWSGEERYTKDLLNIMQSLVGNPDYDQNELRQLLSTLAEAANIATQINQKINVKEGIDYQLVERYDQLVQEGKSKLESEKITNFLKTNHPAFAQVDQRNTLNPEFSSLTSQTQYLYAAGRYEDGFKTAQQLLILAKTDKEKGVAHYWVGLMYYRKNDLVKSESELNLSLKLYPESAGPYVTLSAISMDRNNYPQALEYAQKAIEKDPTYPWGYNDLGLALIGLGRKEEGIAALKKAVELAPQDYIFRDNLTRAQQSQ